MRENEIPDHNTAAQMSTLFMVFYGCYFLSLLTQSYGMCGPVSCLHPDTALMHWQWRLMIHHDVQMKVNLSFLTLEKFTSEAICRFFCCFFNNTRSSSKRTLIYVLYSSNSLGAGKVINLTVLWLLSIRILLENKDTELFSITNTRPVVVTRIISGAETSPPQDHHYGPVAIQQPDQIDDKEKIWLS